MGTITKRGELQWQAKVRRRGFPTQSRTFSYKEDAEKWVRAVERELETSGFVDRREADKNTLAEVLKRYQKEVTPAKKSADIESIKIDVILKDASLPKLKMSAITSAAVASWRDRRLKEVSGATVNREIDVLSTVLNHARREWGIHVDNPIPYVKRPEKARARDRRFSAEEEAYLLAALTGGERLSDGTFSKGARNPWLQPLVQLAMETAMRRGELLALEWENVDLKRQTAYLPDTKNGDARTVPLSTRAVAILAALPRLDGDEEGDGAEAIHISPDCRWNSRPSTLLRGRPTWQSTAWVNAMSLPVGGVVAISWPASSSLPERFGYATVASAGCLTVMIDAGWTGG